MTQKLIWVTAAIGVLVVVAVLINLWSRYAAKGGDYSPASPGRLAENTRVNELRKYFERDRQYQVYIGTPLRGPNRWTRAIRLDGSFLVGEADERLPLAEVTSFLVAYPNGEILDSAKAFGPLPTGVHDIQENDEPIEQVLGPAELSSGLDYVKVVHGKPEPRPDGRWTYSTKLTNVGQKRIRVLRFGGYVRENDRWVLHTINKGFFSADQFVAWYGMGNEHWLSPGQSAEDPDNYGGRPVIWAYFCETESGEKFVAGAELK